MAHRAADAAAEETLDKVIADAAADFIRTDDRLEEKRAALLAEANKAARFHFAKHGGDRGVSKFALRSEAFMNLSNGGFALPPKNFQDAQLQIAEAMRQC